MPRHDLDMEGQDSHGWTTGFPLLLPDGAMLMGFTKMAPDLGTVAAERMGTRAGPQHWRCEVFFLRAENILTETDPEKLEFTVTPEGPDGLWIPDEEDPELRFCQEPFMALLPSGRIICTMRVMNGYPVYSISSDNGRTWTQPCPLRNRPGGDLLKNVCGPCQISSTPEERDYARRYLGSDGTDISWELIRLAWASVANTAITPVQDLLGLGHAARMNTPSTLGPPNWCWRFRQEQLTPDTVQRLLDLTTIYGRTP